MFSAEDLEIIKTECEKGDRGCVQCKKQLAQNIIKRLAPIREKRLYYQERRKLVEEILYEGTKKARQVAQATMLEVREAMKLYSGVS